MDLRTTAEILLRFYEDLAGHGMALPLEAARGCRTAGHPPVGPVDLWLGVAAAASTAGKPDEPGMAPCAVRPQSGVFQAQGLTWPPTPLLNHESRSGADAEGAQQTTFGRPPVSGGRQMRLTRPPLRRLEDFGRQATAQDHQPGRTRSRHWDNCPPG